MFLQGYFLLLWDTPISLIGLGYLLLLAAMFVARPLRGRFCERDAAGHWLGPSPAAARTLLQRQQLHLRACLLPGCNSHHLWIHNPHNQQLLSHVCYACSASLTCTLLLPSTACQT
jgi:hypothetical protein